VDGAARAAGRKVIARGRLRIALTFFAKFVVAGTICTVLFWQASPLYLMVIGHAIAAILNALFNAGIEAVTVTPKGFLNTTTELAFTIDGRVAPIQLVALVMGIPTFIALTLASPWPGSRRFVTVILIGCGVLFLTHILYVVLVFLFPAAMQGSPLPIMIIILPFLLWILLSYWRHIAVFFEEKPSDPPPGDGTDD